MGVLFFIKAVLWLLLVKIIVGKTYKEYEDTLTPFKLANKAITNQICCL